MNVPSYWPSRHWISFAFCPLTCHVTHSPVYLAGGRPMVLLPTVPKWERMDSVLPCRSHTVFPCQSQSSTAQRPNSRRADSNSIRWPAPKSIGPACAFRRRKLWQQDFKGLAQRHPWLSFFVDRKGVVVAAQVGLTSEQEIESNIRKALNQ